MTSYLERMKLFYDTKKDKLMAVQDDSEVVDGSPSMLASVTPRLEHLLKAIRNFEAEIDSAMGQSKSFDAWLKEIEANTPIKSGFSFAGERIELIGGKETKAIRDERFKLKRKAMYDRMERIEKRLQELKDL